jgi:hypothetical protein
VKCAALFACGSATPALNPSFQSNPEQQHLTSAVKATAQRMAVDPAAAMAPDLGPKVAIAPGGSDTSCTFVFLREDHTLGNTLRYILNQDPSVEFAGCVLL